ncbi:phage tail tape measure protein, partial [Pelomicrobium sp. G1]
MTFSSAFEDAIVRGRKLSDVLRGLAQDVTRLFVRRTAVEPLAKAAEGFFGSLLSGFFHAGGVVGVDSVPTRAVPALAFANAPRLHSGGILASDEVPA